MFNIVHLVANSASPERVYAALTTAESICNWLAHESELGFHAVSYQLSVLSEKGKRSLKR